MIAIVICSITLLDCQQWVQKHSHSYCPHQHRLFWESRIHLVDLTSSITGVLHKSDAEMCLYCTRIFLLLDKPFLTAQAEGACCDNYHGWCKETKGYESNGPSLCGRYFGGRIFPTCTLNVKLEAGLSLCCLHIAGNRGLLHSHKTPKASSMGAVGWCNGVANPQG